MKSLLYLISILCIVSFVSCAKESNGPRNIAGKYVIQTLEQQNCFNSNNNYNITLGPDGCGTSNGFEYCRQGAINFTSDGKVTSTLKLIFKPTNTNIIGNALNGSGTYSVSGSTATLCLNGCDDLQISGNTLVFQTKNSTNGCDAKLIFIKQ